MRGEGVQVSDMSRPDALSALGARVAVVVVLTRRGSRTGEAASGPRVPHGRVVRAEAA